MPTYTKLGEIINAIHTDMETLYSYQYNYSDQLADINAQVTTNTSDLAAIKPVIPSDATSSNKLTSHDFVINLIDEMTVGFNAALYLDDSTGNYNIIAADETVDYTAYALDADYDIITHAAVQHNESPAYSYWLISEASATGVQFFALDERSDLADGTAYDFSIQDSKWIKGITATSNFTEPQIEAINSGVTATSVVNTVYKNEENLLTEATYVGYDIYNGPVILWDHDLLKITSPYIKLYDDIAGTSYVEINSNGVEIGRGDNYISFFPPEDGDPVINILEPAVISGVLGPVDGLDAANKLYVDNAISGISVPAPSAIVGNTSTTTSATTYTRMVIAGGSHAFVLDARPLNNYSRIYFQTSVSGEVEPQLYFDPTGLRMDLNANGGSAQSITFANPSAESTSGYAINISNVGRIMGVGYPTGDTDAANKLYVDETISTAMATVPSSAIVGNVTTTTTQTNNNTPTVMTISGGGMGCTLYMRPIQQYMYLQFTSNQNGHIQPQIYMNYLGVKFYLTIRGGAEQEIWFANPSNSNTPGYAIKITNPGRIMGVATPTENTDAANKAYVDNTITNITPVTYYSYPSPDGDTIYVGVNKTGLTVSNFRALDTTTGNYVVINSISSETTIDGGSQYAVVVQTPATTTVVAWAI